MGVLSFDIQAHRGGAGLAPENTLAAFAEAGVTSLQVAPASEDPAATIRQVKEWVS